jgi:hypothetical protein
MHSLSAKVAELVGEDNFEITTGHDEDNNFDDALASIGDLFATLWSGNELTEDSASTDPILALQHANWKL